MTLDDIYYTYSQHPDESTLNNLYTAIRRYATDLATRWRHPDPADAASGVVASIWEHLSAYNGGSFTGWVSQIARNYLRTEYRQWSKTVEFNPEIEIPRGTGVTLELTGLTPTQRETVATLIETGDFNVTATRLGISRDTLMRRLNRLKK